MKISEALNQKDKHTRVQAVEQVKREVAESLAADLPDNAKEIKSILGDLEYNALRSQVLDTKKRVDGRATNEVRPITIDSSLLPRAHGSALFTRGQTQALVAVTLGTANDAQRLDSIDSPSETTRTFMLHYNFPPFSTGEVRPVRGTSRREIGHGNLAERALQAVLPDFADFPYTLRIVSEILESNGSSSMATVCGGSLAMMDAGVPIRGAVAGVAMGLIKEGKKYAILTDILGTEDHLGDMDFKVAGTRNGITSIQMDIKIEGLDLQIMKEALAQAKEGRLHILGEMDKALAEPRADLSPYAPRIVTLQINPEKIGDLIGPKGKTIRGIQDETGAELTVDDTGLVTIAAVGGDAMQRARQMVQAITAEPEIGATYEGTVKTTTAFGAFVEIMPGTEGLVHISELKHGRTEKTEDVVNKGDRVTVKLLDRDERGRLRLSMKALVPKPEGMPEEEPRPPRGEGDGDRSAVRERRRAAAPRRWARRRALAPIVRRGDTPAGAFRRTVLPNGLTVLSETMPGVRSVAFGAWVRAASLHEPRELMGVSHLLEHMVFKGTARRSAKQIALELEALGGSLDAYTSREHTVYQARVLDEHLDIAADVIGDFVFGPSLRASDLDLERKVVLEEIAMVDDTPDDLVFELHNEALWGAHPVRLLDPRHARHGLVAAARRTCGRCTSAPIIRRS